MPWKSAWIAFLLAGIVAAPQSFGQETSALEDPLRFNPIEPFFGRGMTRQMKEGPAQAAKLDPKPPKKLKPKSDNPAIRVYRAHLNGDSKLDYIVKDLSELLNHAPIEYYPPKVCFYDHALTEKFCDKKSFLGDGYQHVLFFRSSGKTYFLSLSGTRESTDSAVYEMDRKTWQPKRIFSFGAYIADRKSGQDVLALAKANDISGVMANSRGRKLRVAWPKNPAMNCLPMIFFHGDSGDNASAELFNSAGPAKFKTPDEIATEFSAIKRKNPGCELAEN